ncbi:hypothetical protein WJX73_010617 [Symbiochloris irregularis]|uniref:adenine phosphoribosyltransferase n=1 Tax=Symbiochloris irregularis TaxID=706552 RepID=A0AAW1P8Y6_9CHLO
MLEERRKVISDSIRVVPHFPKEGIMFQDITTLLLNPIAFQYSIEDFVEQYRDQQVEVVAGFEARGFIFGPPIALALHCPFVPLRKPGKLPGETVSAEYQLEYGSDKIEMSVGAVKKGQRVLLIDDLIATGGTLAAGVKLMKQVGGEVIGAGCVIELPELNGRENLKGTPLYIQVEKEGV